MENDPNRNLDRFAPWHGADDDQDEDLEEAIRASLQDPQGGGAPQGEQLPREPWQGNSNISSPSVNQARAAIAEPFVDPPVPTPSKPTGFGFSLAKPTPTATTSVPSIFSGFDDDEDEVKRPPPPVKSRNPGLEALTRDIQKDQAKRPPNYGVDDPGSPGRSSDDEYERFYHGGPGKPTHPFRIDANKGRKDLDFNPPGKSGFYASDSQKMTRDWAQRNSENKDAKPVVRRYRVPKAELEELEIKRFDGIDNSTERKDHEDNADVQEWDETVKSNRGLASGSRTDGSVDAVNGPVLKNLEELKNDASAAATWFTGYDQTALFSKAAIDLFDRSYVGGEYFSDSNQAWRRIDKPQPKGEMEREPREAELKRRKEDEPRVRADDRDDRDRRDRDRRERDRRDRDRRDRRDESPRRRHDDRGGGGRKRDFK